MLLWHECGTPFARWAAWTASSSAGLFITRVVRIAWDSAKLLGGQHERSVRVRRCPATSMVTVTHLDTQVLPTYRIQRGNGGPRRATSIARTPAGLNYHTNTCLIC